MMTCSDAERCPRDEEKGILRFSPQLIHASRWFAPLIAAILVCATKPLLAQVVPAAKASTPISAPLAASVNTATRSAEPTQAPSQPTAAECSAALAQCQLLSANGQLIEARDQAGHCSNPACPLSVLGECAWRVSELDSAIPLVFFDLRAGGQEVPSALVFVDGKPILDWTKGTALRLNPGEHVFHFDLPLHAPITQTVTLVRAARYKKIYADFVPIAATSAPAVGAPPPRVIQVHFERPVPFIVYPLLAVGAAGALTFTGFGVVGQLEQRNLEKSCAPRCTDGDKSSMRRMFLTADLSLGIGATALIGAGVFYLGRPEKASGPIVGAKLLPGGGAATLTLQHF